MALWLDIGPMVLQFPSFWISEKRSALWAPFLDIVLW
jgi:hypothetical protein